MHTESHYILHGVRAGAKGVVLKTHASEDLVRAIREASRGGTYMSSQVSSALVQAWHPNSPPRPGEGTPTRRHALGRLPTPPPLPENLLPDVTTNLPLPPLAGTKKLPDPENRPA